MTSTTSGRRPLAIGFRCVIAAAMALVAAGPGLPSLAGVRIGGCSVPGAVTPKPGGWVTVETPAFAAPTTGLNDAMTGLWVDPADPRIMLAYSRYSVQRTADAGCHWHDVYEIPLVPSGQTGYESSAPILGDGGIIWDVQSGVAGAAAKRVYLLVAGVDVPNGNGVYRSDDAGATWRLTPSNGLMPVMLRSLAVSPTHPDELYLSGNIPDTYNKVFFASTDGGTTWQQRGDPTKETAAVGDYRLVVDPTNARDVWGYNMNALRHSTDGGQTWTVVDPYPAPCPAAATSCYHGISDLLVDHLPQHKARLWITQWSSLSNTDGYVWGVRTSSNGGRHWLTILTPDRCGSISRSASGTLTLACAAGSAGEQRVSKADVLVWWPARHRWRVITPPMFQPPRIFSGFTTTQTTPAAVAGYVDNPGSTRPWIMRWLGRI